MANEQSEMSYLLEQDDSSLNGIFANLKIQDLIGILVDSSNLRGWNEANKFHLAKNKAAKVYKAAKAALKNIGIEFHSTELD